ncbi:MAG: hypothetical protein ACK5OC_01880 [Pirellula sp.]
MLAQHMVAAFLRDTIFLLIVQDVDNKGVAVTPRFLFTLEGFQMSQSLNFERADQIVNALKQMASKAFAQGQAMDQTEQQLYRELLALGHALVGSIIQAAGDGDVGPATEKNGRMHKRLPKRRRRYRSIFGEFQIERYVYGNDPVQAIQAIPLDEHLGLPETDYSLVLEVWTGIESTQQSFHNAIKTLERITTLHVPLDSAERIEQRLGKSAALVLDNPPSVDRYSEAEILVQTSVCKGIPMVRRQTEKHPVGAPDERKGPKPNQKQMACMAGDYTVDRNMRTAQEIVDALFHIPTREERHPVDVPRTNPRYFAALTKHDEHGNVIGKTAEDQAQQWLTTNTLRRHQHGQEIVVLHDGQRSLWKKCEEYQKDWELVEILDILHALQRIWSAAHILVAKDKLEDKVKEDLWLILNGGIGMYIGGLRRSLHRQGMSKADMKELEKIIQFLDAKKSRMQYGEYLAKGYPIATGFIEGACRHVIKDWMEKSGMRWKEKNAQSMLHMRCIEASELWDVTTEQHRVCSLAKYGKTRKNYSESFFPMAA